MQGTGTRTLTQQRGVTLIEICSTLAIISILLGAGAPLFQKARQRWALEGVAAEVATDLHFARSEAVAGQDGVRFTAQAVADGNCVLIHTGSDGDCQCGNGGAAQCGSGARLVKSAFYPSASGVAVGVNVASIRFEPHNGIATPAGSVTIATPKGHELRHVVNILGRVRSCSPGGTVPGVKAC